jgi:hypothetical protein
MKPLKFFHIPKTAGRSIEVSALQCGVLWGENDSTYRIHWKTQGCSWHQPIYQAMDPNYCQTLLACFDFFCVVRNPYERCISEFYCQHEDGAPNKNVTVEKFNEFIQYKIGLNRTTTHWAPSSVFVFHEGQQIIKHVLKFENLQKEFDKLMALYSLPVKIVCHQHKANKKYGVKDLSPATIKMINEFYADDFRNFDYQMLPVKV